CVGELAGGLEIERLDGDLLVEALDERGGGVGFGATLGVRGGAAEGLAVEGGVLGPVGFDLGPGAGLVLGGKAGQAALGGAEFGLEAFQPVSGKPLAEYAEAAAAEVCLGGGDSLAQLGHLGERLGGVLLENAAGVDFTAKGFGDRCADPDKNRLEESSLFLAFYHPFGDVTQGADHRAGHLATE
ncbi:hypothetical protein EG878_17385, partial [Enterococcus faecalis]